MKHNKSAALAMKCGAVQKVVVAVSDEAEKRGSVKNNG